MSYTIPAIDDRVAISCEFDTLDWLLRNRVFDTVRNRCTEIVGTPDVSARRRSWASLLLAEVAHADSNYTEALRHLEAAVDLPTPLLVRLLATRCTGLLHSGQDADAWQLAQLLVQEHPQSSRAWEAASKVRRKRGDDEGAWLALVHAAQLEPAAFSPTNSLVEMASTTERTRELAPLLRAHIDANPVQIELRVELFSSYVHRGEIDKAIDQGQRVIAFAPVTVIDDETVATVRDALHQLMELPKAE
jgi:lipopolysaccharide biosynthesis regulator YciM